MSATGIAAAEKSHRWHREKLEHYVEPQWCSTRLFEVEPFEGTIQDPFCGFGRIVLAAQAGGLSAFGTDLVDRGFALLTAEQDFFEQKAKVANIVGNPPFGTRNRPMFKKIALRALELSHRKVALIWLTRTLPAAGKWLEKTPLAKILFLAPRPSMPPGYVISQGDSPGGGKQDFCWLIWDHDHVGPPTLGWLRRDDKGGPA